MPGKKKYDPRKKQIELLKYIITCVEKEGRVPTLRQMGAKLGFRHASYVREIADSLIEKGELVKDALVSRGVRLNPKKYSVKVISK